MRNKIKQKSKQIKQTNKQTKTKQNKNEKKNPQNITLETNDVKGLQKLQEHVCNWTSKNVNIFSD